MMEPLLRAALRLDIVEVLVTADTADLSALADRITDSVGNLYEHVYGDVPLDRTELLAKVSSHVDGRG